LHASADTVKPGKPETDYVGIARTYLTRYSLLVILIVLMIIYTILEPGEFLTGQNLKSILLQQSVPVVVSLAVLIPIVAGGFDLSVGYVVGFTSVVAASIGAGAIGDGFTAIVFALAAGTAVGLVNGFFVSGLGINSFIATLGVGISLSGVTIGVSGGQNLFTGIPPIIGELSTTKIIGINSAVWIALVVTLLVYFLLAHTPYGRKMYAVGGNERVARLGGIHVSLLKWAAFAGAGLLAGLGGLLQLGQAGSASPTFGPELLLPAFAAVFLGATSIRPGFFNVWGTILAIFVLAVNFSGLSLLGVPFWLSPVIDGAALIVGVLVAGKGVRGTGV
jgi:ribose transport system permease protein